MARTLLRSTSKKDVIALIDKAMKRGPSAGMTTWREHSDDVAKRFATSAVAIAEAVGSNSRDGRGSGDVPLVRCSIAIDPANDDDVIKGLFKVTLL